MTCTSPYTHLPSRTTFILVTAHHGTICTIASNHMPPELYMHGCTSQGSAIYPQILLFLIQFLLWQYFLVWLQWWNDMHGFRLEWILFHGFSQICRTCCEKNAYHNKQRANALIPGEGILAVLWNVDLWDVPLLLCFIRSATTYDLSLLAKKVQGRWFLSFRYNSFFSVFELNQVFSSE